MFNHRRKSGIMLVEGSAIRTPDFIHVQDYALLWELHATGSDKRASDRRRECWVLS